MKLGAFLVLILFSLQTMAENAFEGVDTSEIKTDQVLIEIDSSDWNRGGQRAVVTILSEGEVVKVVTMSASTAKPGKVTPDFEGAPKALYSQFQSARFPVLKYDHAILFNKMFLLRAANLRGTAKVAILRGNDTEYNVSGKYCLQNHVKCTHGGVALWPEDARNIFQLVKRVGLENTKISIGKGLLEE